MFLLLAILIAAFQVNQQLFDQQQVVVSRVARTASRQIGQLQREHLRLFVLIENQRNIVDQEKLELQLALVQSRIKTMHNTIMTGDTSPEMNELYSTYVQKWQTLQPQIIAWLASPDDVVLKEHITAEMEEIELRINYMSNSIELAFEQHMADWADQSRRMKGLLTMGGISLVIIIVLVVYSGYLFLKNQSQSELRLRAILDTIPDAVFRINSAGIYTDYKSPADDIPGMPRHNIIGRSIKNALPADAADLLQRSIDSVLASGEKLLFELALPAGPTGEIRNYEARLLPSGKDEVQLVARDITTEKHQEEVALQAQKLESLGVLAGGIAHDFNNLLTGMMGQASLALTKLDRGMVATENIQKVILSAKHAAALTQQLLAYTGKGNFQVGPLDLNQLIRETTGLMETALPNHATLELTLQDGLPLVHSDRSQVQQVIMNLFINAIEALPDGKGTISIVTDVRETDEEPFANLPVVSNEVRSGTLKPGTYVALQILDNGSGMDQMTLNRIFDPFFSTKSKGHGLGLSATTGIVRTHQGALRVQSQPHVGTTFTILLPALTTAPVVEEEKGPVPSPIAIGSPKKVLIIDDEVHVRAVATDILAADGYEVVSAANGMDGVALFRANCNCIGVVLLDLKMPGMNGWETLKELRKIQPEIKIIFTSGYSDSDVNPLVSESEQVTFLPKPYAVDALTGEIAQRLST